MDQLVIAIIVFLIVSVLFAWIAGTLSTEWFFQQDPVLSRLKEQLAELHPRFRTVEIHVGDNSFTLNKRKVFICLKDEKGRYYSRNMLCYVILHEYAHMLCDELGHTAKHSRIFEDLLKKAADKGLYNPHIPPISNYCGHH